MRKFREILTRKIRNIKLKLRKLFSESRAITESYNFLRFKLASWRFLTYENIAYFIRYGINDFEQTFSNYELIYGIVCLFIADDIRDNDRLLS